MKIFLYTFLITTFLMTKISASGEETPETLPETSIMGSWRLPIGLAVLLLSFVIYKIQIDFAKAKKDSFERKIIENYED